MKEITLTKPFESLSGQKIESLSLDFDSLKPSDYRSILRIESSLLGVNTTEYVTKKTSSEFRMATAWVAAVKGTKGICLDDIDKICILDLLELEDAGLLFFAQEG
jgi:hypothetical protein